MISEEKIEQRLVRKVKELGGRAYKFVSPGNRGVPDRLVVIKGYTMFIELKAPGGKLSKLQKVQIQRLRNMDCYVDVLSSYKQVDAFVEELKKLMGDAK